MSSINSKWVISCVFDYEGVHFNNFQKRSSKFTFIWGDHTTQVQGHGTKVDVKDRDDGGSDYDYDGGGKRK